ncbi:MAG: NADH-quinone oxidoreductase subunit L [Planctomycetota bacterium]
MPPDTFLILINLAVLLLPLLLAVTLLFWGKRLPRGGDWLAIGGMGAALALALVNLAIFLRAGNPGAAVSARMTWLHLGASGAPIVLPFGILVDNTAAIMAAIVTGLGTAVLVYSIFYMRGDRLYHRYFAYMCFFLFAMLGIVMADNLLMMFVFWELVGLGSYWLIGFWSHKGVSTDVSPATSPALAQNKAFIVNRVGDFGFLTGILILFYVMHAVPVANPLSFDSLFQAARTGAFERVSVNLFGHAVSGQALLTLAGIAIFCGAIGKSAQFPLHVWLPDAMQGPTTASSIIHAATMVAAGVYLTARMLPIFTPEARLVVALVGGVTALMGASIAAVQWDIKAVLAYSTISQLGFMMAGLGCGGYTAGLAHLFTHAFFKCMLFLTAGSVIHAIHTQDLFTMGGLRRRMPLTYLAALAGVMAITGVPLFTGSWSKDLILASACGQALAHPTFLRVLPIVLLSVAAVLTSYYMFRFLFLAFAGEPREESAGHAHESPLVATVPMLILAGFTLAPVWTGMIEIPFLGKLGIFPEGARHWVERLVTDRTAHGTGAEPAHHAAVAVSLLALAAGLAAAWRFYGRGPAPAIALWERSPVLRILHRGATSLWGIDDLYRRLFVRGSLAAARGAADMDNRVLDRIFVDGWARAGRFASRKTGAADDRILDRVAVDGLFGWTWLVLGSVARLFQTGRVQQYAGMSLAALVTTLLVIEAGWRLTLVFGIALAVTYAICVVTGIAGAPRDREGSAGN